MRHIRSSTTQSSLNPNNLSEYRWRDLPVLSHEEEYDLLRLAQGGDASAKRKLVEHFHAYALSLCPYWSKKPGDPDDDIIAAAMFGLARAIDHFDLSTRYRFSTYAKPWIRKYVLLELAGRRRVAVEKIMGGRDFLAGFPKKIAEEWIDNPAERLGRSYVDIVGKPQGRRVAARSGADAQASAGKPLRLAFESKDPIRLTERLAHPRKPATADSPIMDQVWGDQKLAA
jgi:hypothetical protein